MKICDDGHKEIIYEHGKCPLCEANEDLEDLESVILEYEDKVSDLEDQIKVMGEVD